MTLLVIFLLNEGVLKCRNIHLLNGYFDHENNGNNDLIFSFCDGKIISSHKSLWKCHSHNKEFSFISCKYLYFICFVENIHIYIFEKNLRKRSSVENLCGKSSTHK